MSAVLQEMGPEAVAHRDELEEVKRRLSIRHNYFDCWVYGFLENKKFDIQETVSKLQRRDVMERSELANYEITDYMRETMSKGIIQLIGDDKEGRVTFYIVTRRDQPTAKRREENKRNFDMWMSYGTRLRKENKRCRITMLINQKDAGLWANTDMTFQADVALRIAKYYPGVVDRMYICKMGNTLAAMAKPIFSRLPSIVSERIHIITEGDIQKGKLLELFDAHILPVDLGGTNDCDGPKNWTAFAGIVEDHFSQLKHAIQTRGMSVKEWELETLQKELQSTGSKGSTERREAKQMLRSTYRGSMHRHTTPPTAYGSTAQEPYIELGENRDDDDLQSCISDDLFEYSDDDEPRGAARYQPMQRTEDSLEGHHTWRQSTSFSVLPPLHRFLLEEERRWRQAMQVEEAERRFLLCDRYQVAFTAATEDLEDVFGEGGTKRLSSYFPAPARSMLNFFLQCCCVLSAVYFAAGTIFCTSVGCSIIVTFFFGMFVDPKFVYPVGIAMLLASLQSGLVTSRGIELTRLSYYGRLLPGFRYFGSYAQPAQLLFTFALILTQFIIFVVYSVRWDTLNGLRVAFATGWLSGTILITIHHLLYWVQAGDGGWDPSVVGANRNNRSGNSALPIYLLFDITEDDEEEGPVERTSAFLLVLFPVLVSLLFGVAFLVSRLLALAVALPLAVLTAAWAVNAYVDDSTQRYHAVLTKFCIWFGTVVWLFDCYTFGFREYSAAWASPVIAVSLVLGLFVVLALVCHKKGNSSRILRIALLLILAYVVACVIMAFVIVHWTLGVFSLVMAFHGALCISRNSGAAVTISGRFLVSAGTALVVIACVMLGWIGTTPQYASVTAVPLPVSPLGFLDYEGFHATPLCALQLGLSQNISSFSSVSSFGVVNAGIISELASLGSPASIAQGVASYFPNNTMTYFGTDAFPADNNDEATLVAHRFATNRMMSAESSDIQNISFVVVQSPVKLQSVQAMVAWSEAICLSPLSIFLPLNWTKDIIRPYSFSSFMVPFRWRAAMSELETFLGNELFAAAANNRQLYVVASGVAGGITQLVGAKAGANVIAFNAPGVLQIISKFGVTDDRFYRYVVGVTAFEAALTTVGGQTYRNTFSVNCGLDANTCQSSAFLVKELHRLCRV